MFVIIAGLPGGLVSTSKHSATHQSPACSQPQAGSPRGPKGRQTHANRFGFGWRLRPDLGPIALQTRRNYGSSNRKGGSSRYLP